MCHHILSLRRALNLRKHVAVEEGVQNMNQFYNLGLFCRAVAQCAGHETEFHIPGEEKIKISLLGNTAAPPGAEN